MRIACTQYKGISVPHLGVVPGAEGGGREVKSVILMGRKDARCWHLATIRANEVELAPGCLPARACAGITRAGNPHWEVRMVGTELQHTVLLQLKTSNFRERNSTKTFYD